MEECKKPSKNTKKDKYILFAFLSFFGVVFTVDAFFIYTAITTQTGVITEQAYEKGLHYNQILLEAENQPRLNDVVSFDGKTLRWNIEDKSNQKITNAKVTGKIIRPIQDGHDFNIDLVNKGNGVYEAVLDLPFKGLWEAKLESKWNNKTYKTMYRILKK
jgi:nitrogen fixation protein FixH